MGKVPSKILMILIGIILSITVLFQQEYQALGDGALHFVMFDISLGDALLLKTPHGRTIFIDGGVDSSVLSKVSPHLPFWSRKIDLLVITHPDLDHLAGGFEILKRYDVGKVLLTGAVSRNQTFRKFLKEIEQRKIPLIFADKSTDFQFDQVNIDTIFPEYSMTGRKVAKINNTSIVQRISFQNTNLLLTGDIEKSVEEALLLSPVPLQSTILKVAHHGSRSSSLEVFLRATKTKAALISASIGNRFGHPHPEPLERLQEQGVIIFITRDHGDIEIVIEKGHFTVVLAKGR